jgi:UDP-N-acetylglucosamine/UDP-N-acetylgalactosamine diphosphorylase
MTYFFLSFYSLNFFIFILILILKYSSIINNYIMENIEIDKKKINLNNNNQIKNNNEESEFTKFLISKNQNKLVNYLNTEPEGPEKLNFLEKIKQIDFDLLDRLYKSYLEKEKIQNNEKIINEKTKEIHIEPLKDEFSKSDFSNENQKIIFDIGYEKIYKGKIAVLILAGGQGSRLGFEKAKGMYNINMPSNKSLFEYISNRFLSAQNLAKKIQIENSNFNLNLNLNSLNKDNENKPCTLMIMTSKENHKETEEFFKENNYFNIGEENVKLFPQDTLPAIDTYGNVIIKNKLEIFEAPNGNGGCFIALKNQGILNYLTEREIEYINVVSVDNPLTKVLDPFFIGLTYFKKESISAKAIPKLHPKEQVGVFVKLNKKPMIIDYADLNENLATLTEPNSDKLVYNASNILNYLISVDLLIKILNENYKDLINDFHIAKKKIQSYNYNFNNNFHNDNENEDNKFINIPGIKFELFFNSLFLFAENLLLFSIDRNEEFAPIKNPDNSNYDNPRIAREIMSKLFKNWLRKSNIEFDDDNGKNDPFEINFLESYDGENLIQLQKKGKIIIGEKGLFLDKF